MKCSLYYGDLMISDNCLMSIRTRFELTRIFPTYLKGWQGLRVRDNQLTLEGIVNVALINGFQR